MLANAECNFKYIGCHTHTQTYTMRTTKPQTKQQSGEMKENSSRSHSTTALGTFVALLEHQHMLHQQAITPLYRTTC